MHVMSAKHTVRGSLLCRARCSTDALCIKLMRSRPARSRQVCIAGNVHLRWPLVGPMQRQLGFLTFSWYLSAKVSACVQCMQGVSHKPPFTWHRVLVRLCMCTSTNMIYVTEIVKCTAACSFHSGVCYSAMCEQSISNLSHSHCPVCILGIDKLIVCTFFCVTL